MTGMMTVAIAIAAFVVGAIVGMILAFLVLHDELMMEEKAALREFFAGMKPK